MTAAIYAGRQKMNTLLITKDFGGQIGKKAVYIENYPGFEKITGIDLIKNFLTQVKTTEIEILTAEVTKIKKEEEGFVVLTNDKRNYKAISVIVASGSDPRPLEAKGEKEFLGKGLSYCALCDGPLFKDKEVAIAGGGNAAFETVRFLLNYIKKIYILEFGSKVCADQTNQEIVRQSGRVEIITNAAVKEIKGDNFVSAIVYEDTRTKEQKELKVGGVFVEIGYHPATAFVKELVDFTDKDEIQVEPESMATKTEGLFAAGDCNSGKYKQIVTAAGEGAKAALAAYGYIEDLKYKK